MLILHEGELLHTDSSTDILEHYGVKGMKWGKRLFKSSSPEEKIKNAKREIEDLKKEEKEINKFLKNRKNAKSPDAREKALSYALENSYSVPELAVNSVFGVMAPVSSSRYKRESVRREIRDNEEYINRIKLKKSVKSANKKYKEDKKSAKTRAEREALKNSYLNTKYNLEEAYWRK